MYDADMDPVDYLAHLPNKRTSSGGEGQGGQPVPFQNMRQDQDLPRSSSTYNLLTESEFNSHQAYVPLFSVATIRKMFATNWCSNNFPFYRKVGTSLAIVLLIATLMVTTVTMKHATALSNIGKCELLQDACMNGGICKNMKNSDSFRCHCPAGFSGHNCQYSLCAASERSSREDLSVVTLADCGGLIKMPNLPTQSSFLLDYKSNETYKKAEHCLWTLCNVHNNVDHSISVRITMLCEGFETAGGLLSVVHLKLSEATHWLLSSDELNTTHRVYETNSSNRDRRVFLSFASTEKRGTGFFALVEVLQKWEVGSTGSNLFFNASTRRQNFGPFELNDRTAIVVNPQQNITTFTVDYLHAQKYSRYNYNHTDQLDVYVIPPRSKPIKVMSLTGIVETPHSVTSEYPFVAFFQTWASTTGKGFQISWK